MSLRESARFVGPDVLPAFTHSTSVTKIYADLTRARVGSFFLHSPSGELDLIRGDELARAVGDLGGPSAWEQMAKLNVGEVLRRVNPDKVKVPVAADDLEETASEESLANRPAAVFRVLRAGRLAGYFLSRAVVSGLGPRRVVFICRRNHRNPDPDGGHCYQCPSPIVRTETE